MAILTFDDNTTLSDFGMIAVKGAEMQLLGTLSSRTEKVPGRKGLLDFGNEMGAITDSYPIAVVAKNEVERSYQMRAFKLFLLDDYGLPRYVKVHNSVEPDVYYWAKITTAPTPELFGVAANFVLEITNYEGVKYSIAEADEVLWGSQSIGFQSNYLLSHTGSGAKELAIRSNVSFVPFVSGMAVHPYFVLEGSGTNVKIICSGQEINVGTFTGKLEIDTENRIAYLNGAEKLMRMNKFLLVRNRSVTVTGTNMNFKLSNHFRDEF